LDRPFETRLLPLLRVRVVMWIKFKNLLILRSAKHVSKDEEMSQ